MRQVIKIGVRGGKIVADKFKDGKQTHEYQSARKGAMESSLTPSAAEDDDEPTFALPDELTFGDELHTPAGDAVKVGTQGYEFKGSLWGTLGSIIASIAPGTTQGWKSWFTWKGNPKAAAPTPPALGSTAPDKAALAALLQAHGLGSIGTYVAAFINKGPLLTREGLGATFGMLHEAWLLVGITAAELGKVQKYLAADALRAADVAAGVPQAIATESLLAYWQNRVQAAIAAGECPADVKADYDALVAFQHADAHGIEEDGPAAAPAASGALTLTAIVPDPGHATFTQDLADVAPGKTFGQWSYLTNTPPTNTNPDLAAKVKAALGAKAHGYAMVWESEDGGTVVVKDNGGGDGDGNYYVLTAGAAPAAAPKASGWDAWKAKHPTAKAVYADQPGKAALVVMMNDGWQPSGGATKIEWQEPEELGPAWKPTLDAVGEGGDKHGVVAFAHVYDPETEEAAMAFATNTGIVLVKDADTLAPGSADVPHAAPAPEPPPTATAKPKKAAKAPKPYTGPTNPLPPHGAAAPALTALPGAHPLLMDPNGLDPTFTVYPGDDVSPDGKWLAPTAVDGKAIVPGYDFASGMKAAGCYGSGQKYADWASGNGPMHKWLLAQAKSNPDLYRLLTTPYKKYTKAALDTHGNLVIYNSAGNFWNNNELAGKGIFVVQANPMVPKFKAQYVKSNAKAGAVDVNVGHVPSLILHHFQSLEPDTYPVLRLVGPTESNALHTLTATMAAQVEGHGAGMGPYSAYYSPSGNLYLYWPQADKLVAFQGAVPKVEVSKEAKAAQKATKASKAPAAIPVATHEYASVYSPDAAEVATLADMPDAESTYFGTFQKTHPLAAPIIAKTYKAAGGYGKPYVYVSGDKSKAAFAHAGHVHVFDLTGTATPAEAPKAKAVPKAPGVEAGTKVAEHPDPGTGSQTEDVAALGYGDSTLALASALIHAAAPGSAKLKGLAAAVTYAKTLGQYSPHINVTTDGKYALWYSGFAGKNVYHVFALKDGVPAPATATTPAPTPPAMPVAKTVPKADVPKLPDGTAYGAPKVLSLAMQHITAHPEVQAHGGIVGGWSNATDWLATNPDVWAHLKGHVAGKTAGGNSGSFEHLLKQNGTFIGHTADGALVVGNYANYVKHGGGRMAVLPLATGAPVPKAEPKAKGAEAKQAEPTLAVPEKPESKVHKAIATKGAWGSDESIAHNANYHGLSEPDYRAKMAEWKAAAGASPEKYLRHVGRVWAAAKIAEDVGNVALTRQLQKEYQIRAAIASDALGGTTGADYFAKMDAAVISRTPDWNQQVETLRHSESARLNYESELLAYREEFLAAAEKNPPDTATMMEKAVRIIKRRDALGEAAKKGYVAEAGATSGEAAALAASTGTPPPLSVGLRQGMPGVNYGHTISHLPDTVARHANSGDQSALSKAASAQQSKWTAKERSVVKGYTGADYHSLNAVLRGVDSDNSAHLNANINAMTAALDKCATPHEMIVWRSVPAEVHKALKMSLQEFGEAVENGFGSHTTSTSMAASWGGGGAGIIEARIPAGYPATYVQGSVSSHSSEYELIVQRSARYRLVGVKKVNIGGTMREVLQVDIVPAEHPGTQEHAIASA